MITKEDVDLGFMLILFIGIGILSIRALKKGADR